MGHILVFSSLQTSVSQADHARCSRWSSPRIQMMTPFEFSMKIGFYSTIGILLLLMIVNTYINKYSHCMIFYT
eukprot:COSAG01_NODE_3250_length_6353_cov_445.752958_6_plen_73_part_00